MRLSNNLAFPSTSDTAHRSLPHIPRSVSTSHGLRHTTVIIIIVSASVGSLLVAIVFWRIFLRRPRSAAPLPLRQALVHRRELQLAAFTEHKNASHVKILPDVPSTVSIPHGSTSSLVPYVGDSPASTSNRASSYTHETDARTEADFPSHGNQPHPPTLPFPPRIPPSASSTSLPIFNDRSPPSSEVTTSPATFSTSVSPSQSFRRPRPIDRATQRPYSMVSIGTMNTTTTMRSRPSVRAAPHAPHSNVQIVLPAPLAPGLYERPASEIVDDNTYMGSWRSSMVDTWVSVSQHGMPEPEPTERRRRRGSTEGRSRLKQKGPSPGPLPPRSRSNPSPLSPRQSSSLSHDTHDTHPPVPLVPSEFGTLPRRHARAPKALPRHGPSS
ncbi:hypothetical protein BJV74DRAFT_804804 [Russula compacta]|nr:hypothetical protein BJV74DRAFT_804804 [Russula compacta]